MKEIKALGGVWTEQRLEELKKAREIAVVDKRQIFLFEDKEIYVDFAKYLIDYLEGEFNDKG